MRCAGLQLMVREHCDCMGGRPVMPKPDDLDRGAGGRADRTIRATSRGNFTRLLPGSVRPSRSAVERGEVGRWHLRSEATLPQEHWHGIFPCLRFGEDGVSQRPYAIASLVNVANLED